jgi:hypothetical protein
MSNIDSGEHSGIFLNLKAKEGSALLSEPIVFPDQFKNWLLDYFAVNPPQIPFSQIFGSRLNVARSGDFIATAEAGTSTTAYHDLATVGPLLENVADGKYLVTYGAHSRDSTSLSVNGSTPSDDDRIYGKEFAPAGVRSKIVSVSNNHENTFKLQYKGTRTFSRRWLTIVRIGAPGA